MCIRADAGDTTFVHAQRGLRYLSRMSVSLSVCQSVCLLPRFLPLRATGEQKLIAIRGGLLLQRLHFKKGDFRITAAFKSYGLKTKRTS